MSRIIPKLASVTLLIAAVVSSGNCFAQKVEVEVATASAVFRVFENGSYELLDRKAGASWRPVVPGANLGRITFNAHGKPEQAVLGHGSFQRRQNGMLATFHPDPADQKLEFRVRVQPLRDGGLGVAYDADEALHVENARLLPDLIQLADTVNGYVLVPVREGLLIPSNNGVAFDQRFDTYAYEGCHMEMIGAVQNGAALLVTWEDPYVAAHVKSVTNTPAGLSFKQLLTCELSLQKSAHSFHIEPLGRGNFLQIAQAYRKIADSRGLVVPWSEKLKGHPERAKLFGAANIKLWSTLDRRMNEESTKEELVRTNWTFSEAAQVAEHLKRDLKLDRVLFTIGGWIHRGYDNQHPDILPTAPECGGDVAFADCARRVMDQGYLFCLHDNYQDIYRDSPSWNERYIMKTLDGKPARGGHWAGGLAFLTCSKTAVELAKRPQNLSAVKTLSDANSYFIDTTYASGLQECFDPEHPLKRGDDIHWKQQLSDYARDVFGVFGSECGREWAIPHSDFFEGLTGVSGTYYHDAGLPGRLGATVIPLFEMVYRDCIAMYGKYGYDPSRATEYVLHHISIGRPLNYHSMPAHLYWQKGGGGEGELALRPGIADLKQRDKHTVEATYSWTTEKTPSEDWSIFVHFTDRNGNIKWQGDYRPETPIHTWQAGDQKHGPFRVNVPEGLAGTFNVRMGLFKPDTGERALLQGRDNGDRSYLVGRISINGDKMEFQRVDIPAEASISNPFVHAENGWAERLHPMDRFIKNTYEVLSPLNEITAQQSVSNFEFLTPDHRVRRTVFGTGSKAVRVTVNMGSELFTAEAESGRVTLPANGFLVESPQFVAFYALNWNGLKYESPAMFCLRSADGKRLSKSRKIRVFHGLGPERIRVGQKEQVVRTEAVVD